MRISLNLRVIKTNVSTSTPAPIILNVDDDEGVRYARHRILSLAGFQVFDASNAAETVVLAEEKQPDLVLLDVHLPDGSGIELCRKLKGPEKTASWMVLQISASALTASHAKESLDAGADGYLMEPVDPDVLVATVRSLLRLRQAEQALVSTNQKLENVNSELKRSNQDLEQFAFAASHDLQEPLRNISVFLALLDEELAGTLTERQNEYFTRVLQGAGRMGALIQDLLAYSQVGREGRQHSIVDLRESVAEAVQTFHQSASAPDFSIEVAPDLPAVVGDSTHLVSVFHNLISNALKYRRPDVETAVRIWGERSPGGELTVSVQDNGIGIAPAYQQQIFEPFKRLHGSEIPGNGIGLAVCRRIIQSHGGQLWVESELGSGSTFRLTLRPAANPSQRA